MTSMRRRYVASTSLRRHVSAGNLPPPLALPIFKTLPPQYFKPFYAYALYMFHSLRMFEIIYLWRQMLTGPGILLANQIQIV